MGLLSWWSKANHPDRILQDLGRLEDSSTQVSRPDKTPRRGTIEPTKGRSLATRKGAGVVSGLEGPPWHAECIHHCRVPPVGGVFR